MKTEVVLSELGIVCSIGNDKQQVLNNLVAKERSALTESDQYYYCGKVKVGQVKATLPSLEEYPSHYQSRNNALAKLAYEQIKHSIEKIRNKVSAQRIGIIIGTSTSSINEGEKARQELLETGHYSPGYHYHKQEFVAPANFIAKLVGGVDSLCKLTLNGFSAIASTSDDLCQPFSKNRDGINIGEAAALFLMCKADLDNDKMAISLLGTGESSDAHHISAPHPEGEGAAIAIEQAIISANISRDDVDYINLHGTGTPLNDLMEAKALIKVFNSPPLVSSTKSITGHTLGAAGALEVGFCWLLLSQYNNENLLPIHHFDGEYDDEIPALSLVSKENIKSHKINICMSNSFAFGGSNACVIIGKTSE